MKRLLMALLFLTTTGIAAHAQTGHVVISQVYGAGGNSSAPFTHDFVELFNPTDKVVSLAGWSIQYATATDDGGKWGAYSVPLSGSIEPGKYFLIQLNGGTIGNPLPAPDLIGSFGNGLSATDGKLALVNSITPLTGRCPVSTSIIDFIGYGKGDCFETAAAPATSTAKGITRKNNGCTDTDDNAADFYTAAPSPRNSSAPANWCNGASVKITFLSANTFCITPISGATGSVGFEATGQFSNAVFNAVISDANGSFTNSRIIGTATISGTNPKATIDVQIPEGLHSSNAYRIRVDVVSPSLTGLPGNAIEIINGAGNVITFSASPNADKATLNWINPAACFDEVMLVAKEGSSVNEMPTGDGAAYIADLNFTGNGTLFNGGKVIYKGTQNSAVVSGLQTGKEYYVKAFTRRGIYWSTGIETKVKTRLLPQPGEILINQVSPQYDSASHEYIELVNTTDKTFDLSELSISYHAKTGNKAVAGNTLTGTLQPHSYWLLSPKEVVAVGKTSLARDGHCTDGFAATAGQIALLRKTDSTIIDGFGYGSIDLQTYTESQPAPAPTSKGGFRRKQEGTDTNNNLIDFERVANSDIDLRNSQSRLAIKDAIISSGNYTRLYVTGNASIGGNVTISEKVVLKSGMLQLLNNQLTTLNTEGGGDNSYLQTNGSGSVTLQNINEAAKTAPVGNATYNPVTISNGGGADWQVAVTDEIKSLPAPFNVTEAVLRTWQVKPLSNITNGATIQLQYKADAQQAGAAFTNEEVQVWNYTSQWTMASMLQKQLDINGAKTATINAWKQAGTFVVANATAQMSSFSVLPIKFTNVKATELAHAIQIEFTNSTESDVAAYIIQRSANGIDFIDIATLAPLHNNGGEASYQWLDKTRPAGNNFYRIKGVELDGKMMYSIVLKTTANQNTKALIVFPNPVQGRQLNWEATLPQSSYMLRITSSSGQQIISKKMQHSGGNINQVMELPAGLRSGLYYLQLSNGNFIKQQMFVVL